MSFAQAVLHSPILLAVIACATSFAADPLPKLALEPVVAGLHRPTSITSAHDGSSRLFVTEQTGTVRIIHEGRILPEPFLDIRSRLGHVDEDCCDERGLLSIAFPPGFRESGRFYVYFTGEENEIHIAPYQVSTEDPNRTDPETEEVLLRVEHKYENHFGGQLAFHPIDQKLYVSFGDGAGGGNPLRSSQSPEMLFGKVWRWDAEGGGPLELYSLGLRNPWRFSFDRLTGDLYVGDVGEDTWEEVNFQPAGQVGANFGWSVLEGNACFEQEDCPKQDFQAPAVAYHHETEGCSVTGGVVYRGEALPQLQGVYLYGDFCSGRIWGMRRPAEDSEDG